MKPKTKGKAGPIDKFVAARIKEIRTTNEQTIMELSAFLGMSYQQVQKYESGKTSISAGTLFKISTFLRVPVGALFAGMPATDDITQLIDQLEDQQHDIMRKPENVRLVTTFMRIGDLKVRKKIFVLMDELSLCMDDASAVGGIQ